MSNIVNVAWMYPDILNLHGERGNAKAFELVSKKIGVKLNIDRIDDIDSDINYENYDILLFNAGELKHIEKVKEKLENDIDKIKEYIKNNKIIFVTGTTGALFAHNIDRLDGSSFNGLNLLDMDVKERNMVLGDDLYYKFEKMEIMSSQIQMIDITLNKAKEGKIGIISDENDTEGYVLAQNIIKKDKIKESNLVKYDDYMSMLNDLYDGEVGSIFVSGSYADKYSSIDKYAKIDEEVKELDSYSKRMKKQVDKTTEVSTKKVTEPFTMLLLGVDSPTEDISKASGLGDSIMLVTFNPKTLTATMFSIPRDTYVPIACRNNAENKINSSAASGTKCVIDTIENLTDIDIDYYVKVNFKGVVDLVDALNGIDVDVPVSFCEQEFNINN